MNIDENFFFKKAPLVIVVMGKDKVSASLAAENMAFMAEAIGLGKKSKAVTTLVIGYPAVKYYRTVHRHPVTIIEA